MGRGFATSGRDSSMVMFDLNTFRPLAKIHAAEDTDAIIYDAASDRVFRRRDCHRPDSYAGYDFIERASHPPQKES